MSIKRFFIKKIFIRRFIFSIVLIILFLGNSYTIFKATRGLLNTYLGYKEFKPLEKRNAYVAWPKVDEYEPDPDIEKIGFPKIRDYLDKNFKWGGYTDGSSVTVGKWGTGKSLFPNRYNKKAMGAYMTEEYYNTIKFKLKEGKDLYFNFKSDGSDEIPVLIGANLAKDYPVGSKVVTYGHPGLEGKKVTYRVQGILKSNTYHSWIKMYDNKNYYNFCVLIPDSEKKYFGDYLYQLLLFDTNQEEADKVEKVIYDNIGDKISFHSMKYTRKVNVGEVFGAIGFLMCIVLGISFIITLVSIWVFKKFIKLQIKDFTINLMIGLDYKHLRRIFLGYLSVISFIALIITTIACALQRCSFWSFEDGDGVLATNGLFGMIGVDYISLLISFTINLIIAFIITKISIRIIKKVPISIGVLQ